MFCRYCGKQVPDDSNFCPYCQKQLSENAPKETEPKNEEKKVFVPKPASFKTEQPITKKNTQTNGIIAWVLSTYNILMIFMLLLGLLGYYTTPGDPGEIWMVSFKGSSLLLINAVGYMSGASFKGLTNVPIWIGYAIPITFIVLALVFAIIQITKNKKKFSVATLICVCVITVITILISFVIFDPIKNAIPYLN